MSWKTVCALQSLGCAPWCGLIPIGAPPTWHHMYPGGCKRFENKSTSLPTTSKMPQSSPVCPIDDPASETVDRFLASHGRQDGCTKLVGLSGATCRRFKRELLDFPQSEEGACEPFAWPVS